MPNTRGNRHGGASGAAEDLARVIRDEKIIAQRLEEVPLRTIAKNVGCALSTAQAAVDRWKAEHAPTPEQVEELRLVQAAQIDAVYAEVRPHLMRPLRDSDGEIIYDGNGDDRKPLTVPDVAILNGITKLWERKARLFGADLERSLGDSAVLPSAEIFAQVLGWDSAEPAIDVLGEELPAEPPAALEPGADSH
jgi:hypothetical protein